MYPRPAAAGNRSSSRTCPTSEPWCAGSVSLGAIGNGCALAAQCVARGPKSFKFDAEQKCLKTACYPAGWATLSWQGAILRPSDTPQFKRCPPIVADAAAPRNAKNPIAQEFSAGIQRRRGGLAGSLPGAATTRILALGISNPMPTRSARARTEPSSVNDTAGA